MLTGYTPGNPPQFGGHGVLFGRCAGGMRTQMTQILRICADRTLIFLISGHQSNLCHLCACTGEVFGRSTDNRKSLTLFLPNTSQESPKRIFKSPKISFQSPKNFFGQLNFTQKVSIPSVVRPNSSQNVSL